VNKKNNIPFFLGSSSHSRQMLLREAGISFTLVPQNADESKCDWGLQVDQVVQNIAVYKMDHVVLPIGVPGDTCFVLTADTLNLGKDGIIKGKPVDRIDAIAQLKDNRSGLTATAFCLDKRLYKNGTWEITKRSVQIIKASHEFYVPDEWINTYLEKSMGTKTAGAIAIEGFGAQFLRSVQGSYTTIIGLPMCEVRQTLQKFGFFD
jgi:septum formation protein